MQLAIRKSGLVGAQVSFVASLLLRKPRLLFFLSLPAERLYRAL